MKKYMTKKEAENLFKEEYKQFLLENKNDKTAIRTAWNDFTLYADSKKVEKLQYILENVFCR